MIVRGLRLPASEVCRTGATYGSVRQSQAPRRHVQNVWHLV